MCMQMRFDATGRIALQIQLTPNFAVVFYLINTRYLKEFF